MKYKNCKNSHPCMYCGKTVYDSNKKDELCRDCKQTFGHWSFYDL